MKDILDALLLAETNPLLLLLVLLFCIPYIVKAVKFIGQLIADRRKSKKELIQQGYDEAQEETKMENRFSNGEKRMTETENELDELELKFNDSKAMLDLLVESDKLRIKREIKKAYDRAMKRGVIDALEFELLTAEFEIYQKEGGNSWAEMMMTQMAKLPTYSNIDPQQ